MKTALDSTYAPVAPPREEGRAQKDGNMPVPAGCDSGKAEQSVGGDSSRRLPRDARPAWLPAAGNIQAAGAQAVALAIATADAGGIETAAGRHLPSGRAGQSAWAGSEGIEVAALLAARAKPTPSNGKAAPEGDILSLGALGARHRACEWDREEESEAIVGVDDRVWYLAMAAVDGTPRREVHPPPREPLPDGAGRHVLGKCCRHQVTTAGETVESVGVPAGYCLRMRRPCRFHRP